MSGDSPRQDGPLVALSVSSFGSLDDEPRRILERAGARLVDNPHGRKLSADEALDLIQDADGVVAGTEPLTAEVLGGASRLRVISRVGTGIDSIDLDAARERGIVVRNTPDAVTDAVAELTLAGMLALLRQVAAMDADLRAGTWKRRMGDLLASRTVGIVGLGRVGLRVAELVAPFGARVLAHDVAPDHGAADRLGVELVSLENLVGSADIVTIHVSGVDAPILDAPRIAALRGGTLVINAARGGLVDERALLEGLRSGHLGGAYLDVFAEEPYTGPLRDEPNMLMTPHAGSYARATRLRMEIEAAENLLDALGMAVPKEGER